MRQPSLFEAARPSVAPLRSPSPTPDPKAIRARLYALLDTARAAQEMPWEPTRARVHRTLFHNMANWLPQAERDSLRLAFVAEMDRLAAATPASPPLPPR